MSAPPDAASAALPASARFARRALLVGLAAGPAAWLLLPPLLRPGVVPGVPSAGIYPLLHRLWAAVDGAPPRFPEPGAQAPADVLATLLSPLTGAVGAPATFSLVALAGLGATLAVTWRYTRRFADGWTAAAATAAFTASPAVVAGVASGDLEAWQGWALLALPLTAGPAALGVGLAAALFAPTMLPAAFLPAAWATWTGEGRGRWWPLVGWALAVAARSAVGWPAIESRASYDAWFALLEAAPAPERVNEVYVGFAAVALLLAGLARPGATRRVAGLGLAALAGSVVTAPVPPERFLHLVPLAAAIAGLGSLRTLAPAWGPAAAVWAATALVGEGWKGVATPVPLATATLAEPAPVEEIAEGPVLDLPATRGAIRRGLWFQARHGQPVAADVDGLVTGEVSDLAAALSTGGCADPGAVGFRTVVARREGALRELGGLRACLGEPAWDDGAVAVWRFDRPRTSPATPAPRATATPGEPATATFTDPPPTAPPAGPLTPGSAPPAPGR